MRKQLLLLGVSFVTTMAMAQKIEDATKYAPIISKAALKEKLTILSGADMEGRETASPGQKKAAAYIEEQFKRIGLKPGNGDSYQQRFPVYRDQLTDKQLMVNGKPYEWDKDFFFDFRAIPNGSSTFNNFVFAGYGIVDSTKSINDLADLDVKGKIVIVLEGSATGPAAPGGRTRFSPSSTAGKAAAARKAGAAGLVLISADFPRKQPTSVLGAMSLKNSDNSTSFVTVTVSEEAGSALLGKSAKLSVGELKDAANKGSYTADMKVTAVKSVLTLESSNVIGVLPGTDKKDEYLFLTGHYDHLGKQGNVIFYGADDDGSGTVNVIQMAEAFAAAAKKGDGPRRTIIFMTVSGEEKGLIGSEYYSEHPTVSMDKTTVDLNTDMIGRTDTERKSADSLNYLYVIGHDKLSSDLPIINEGINDRFTKLVLDYKYDDPKDVNRIYYRSDHYNFARKGVPVLFFYDGMLLSDYHRPTDTVDKINFDLMERRAHMIFYTAWEMANRDEMLKRDKPLNMPAR